MKNLFKTIKEYFKISIYGYLIGFGVSLCIVFFIFLLESVEKNINKTKVGSFNFETGECYEQSRDTTKVIGCPSNGVAVFYIK
jgi:hypothetical protein